MRRLILCSVLALTLAAGTAAAQQFSSLEERMSAKEFKEAGLDKLTPEELAKLNEWLGSRALAPSAAYAPGVQATMPAPPEDRRGFLASEGDGSAIVGSIAGEYKGWRKKGDKIFLANGHVWEVVDADAPKLAISVTDPTVKIEPGMLGAWYFSVDGYNARVRVRRIK